MTPAAPDDDRAPPRRAGRLPSRAPLVERKRAQRAAARRVMRARTRTALTGAQRAVDPLDHGRRGAGRQAARVLVALLIAAALHVAIVAVGSLIGGQEPGRRETIQQVVKVEMREPPPPPPPVEEKKAEPPKPEPIAKPVRPPPVKRAPPPAPAPPKGPPPRVVGINLESTTEGGDGPAFAVGDTRAGQTADKAAAPQKAAPPAAPRAPAVAAPAVKNEAATRIPVAGIKYTQVKRRRESKPPYPETLKAQGIEADVMVMAWIDATGKVTQAKVIKAAPYPEFNEAARLAALKEDFEPELRDGVPMASTLSWIYRFRLETE
jgi:protein TonB